ncbi:hypothetical protein [sulfur-oxidizing endosymbiont of Gigantopelta aegis]|uniref:hypothetical protein n=1 Tax=sulfur-oxidizing endosymbiont of Gigantopelta aegis TaxID=2794934 RepID=UPI0018DD2B46|nr:hypothetical protein [sulfur-oxidizing endosymbiont of Gigantopelta aegis]
MNIAYLNSNDYSFFFGAQDQLEQLIKQLQTDKHKNCEHGDIEDFINKEGQEILRRLLQGWLDLKAANEEKRSCVNTVSGDKLNYVRTNTHRSLNSLFGQVTATRNGYSQRNKDSLFPIDAELNLSTNSYSDGIYFRVSKEAIRGSFDDVVESIDSTTAGHVPKRQCLNIVRDVAQDFEGFYKKKRFIEPEKTSDFLVLTFDGKG